MAPHAPSRTFSLGRYGIAGEVLLALLATVVCYAAPARLEALADLYKELGYYLMLIVCGGVAGLVTRDSVTGGLTSSSSAAVLESTRIKNPPPPADAS